MKRKPAKPPKLQIPDSCRVLGGLFVVGFTG